ncbi:MAG: 4-amino-4-deoxy-L-arabinose transferase-like glycosyltransferase [Lysobacterales bacterium]|jgi:4-amino-4-deoxy-L-arabinose transferase-like glycosyltransferase
MSTRQLWFLLFLILFARLLTMGMTPVLDTTESRYSEISRLMLVSGDWAVPQIREGEPFWGKPPLFAWLTAGSFKLFGISPFAARIPHFLLGLATLFLVFRLSRAHLSQNYSLLALVILSSTPLFFVSSGTVMTESGLLFSTTLSMAGFWFCLMDKGRIWGLAFFAGLGLGMLAKGPVAVIMTCLPIFAWWFLGRKQPKPSLTKLPWLSGITLSLIIAVPWYLVAEQRNPGFLEYFLIGEHFLRFIQPGWQGDLYGNAHSEPLGMIWFWWFQATAAWGVLLAFVVLKFALSYRSRHWPSFDDWQIYLICWFLAPLVFFTFSGNILWTYVISGMPAFALLLAGSQAHRS